MRIKPLYLGIAALVLNVACSENLVEGHFKGNLRGYSVDYYVQDADGRHCHLGIKIDEDKYIGIHDGGCNGKIDEHDDVEISPSGYFGKKGLEEMGKLQYIEDLLAEARRDLYDKLVPEVVAKRKAEMEAEKAAERLSYQQRLDSSRTVLDKLKK
ncbi:MAG: hypothetical protein WCV90_02260 [Candidatus Woesearchaeota archaeon]|jgi:hypothetical protein